MPRAAHKSGAALRYERQMREAKAALAAQAAQVRSLRERPSIADEAKTRPPQPADKHLTENAKFAQVDELVDCTAEVVHPVGLWPIADLRAGQCRFACTPHTARAEEHRFCGEPVAWLRGKPTSWCAQHLAVISGAPGRAPGGASLADHAAGHAAPDQRPVPTGWGATGAQR